MIVFGTDFAPQVRCNFTALNAIPLGNFLKHVAEVRIEIIKDGSTALMRAAIKGHQDIVEILIKNIREEVL